MKTRPLVLLTFSCAALLASLSPSLAASPSRIDPKALEALKRMSTTLSSTKAFTYKTTSIVEAPGITGQFITLFSHAEVTLQRPNKLSARLTGEAPNFNFYYDGTTVAATAPATKTYSVMPAPSTIDAMIPALEQETGIRFATAPLLLSDPYRVMTRSLSSAIVVGPALVNGIACQHLAFRSPGINWEIWIQSGSSALPRRLAVTFTDRPNFPRTLVEFSNWNLHPWLRASSFNFQKPAGFTEIPFLSVVKPKAR